MAFIEDEPYSRRKIHDVIGGGIQDYLSHRDGRVVAACLRPDKNPGAPKHILVGPGKETRKWANVPCSQQGSIPVFVNQASKAWLYRGDFRVARTSEDRETLDRYRKDANRPEIVKVIHLERVQMS